jgi:hypothetical protein
MMQTRSQTLAEALPEEIERVQTEVIPAYESLLGVPNIIVAPQIAMMKAGVAAAIKASAEGDTVGMLRCYEELSEWDV